MSQSAGFMTFSYILFVRYVFLSYTSSVSTLQSTHNNRFECFCLVFQRNVNNCISVSFFRCIRDWRKHSRSHTVRIRSWRFFHFTLLRLFTSFCQTIRVKINNCLGDATIKNRNETCGRYEQHQRQWIQNMKYITLRSLTYSQIRS